MRHMGGALRCGAAIAAAAASAALGLTACSAGGTVQTLPSAPQTAAPAPSAGVSVQAAPSVLPSSITGVLVLRAYAGFWTAQVKALDSGTVTGSGLQTYSIGAALSGAYTDSQRLNRAGLLMSGAPRSNPSVTEIGTVAPSSGVQSATVQDCLDITGWHQIDQKTRQLRDPAHRLTRYRVTATARTVGGVWMISDVHENTGQSC
ncbi:hypothetical protein ABUW04_15230 [Streptacidiphilus sp. N1-10]|uniref:Lipoprotein n=1 Tax=Streptacidiphilus jeojiensis TaxID=3229225 RepID=A0ABV6XMW1_9ACTN